MVHTLCLLDASKMYFDVCKPIFHILVIYYGPDLGCMLLFMKLEDLCLTSSIL